MHISPLEEYGLRCALTLAQHYNRSTLSARAISLAEGISIEYVSKVMFLLRKTGVVTAVRGKNGGFHLVKNPHSIHLNTVLNSFSQKKDKNIHFCDQFSGNNKECIRIKNCSIRPVWNLLNRSIHSLFQQITLGDLLEEELKTQKNISQILQNSITNHFSERTPASC